MHETPVNIAFLSGKGGTGKTFLAVNLAAVAGDALYVDCDVEEPNGHLFWKPSDITTKKVVKLVPVIDETKCVGCRTCSDFCRFNALVALAKSIKVFEDLCHSCGGCTLLCPEGAISEKERPIGEIQKGTSQEVTVLTGILNKGEPSGVPIIKELLSKEAASLSKKQCIDCPPGSACMTMESIRNADYCVLVAEPTIFGVHNLAMVHELVKIFHKPYGVIVNKCFEEKNPAEQFCTQQAIPLIAQIPFAEELGTINSSGRIAAREHEHYRTLFAGVWETLSERASKEL